MNKIIFIIGVMGNGGAERVISTLANQFSNQNIEIGIIGIYGSEQDYELNEKINFIPIQCKSRIKVVRPFERINILRRIITEMKPDCVVSFLADVNIHTILALRGRKIPIVISERNDPNQDPGKAWVRKLRNLVYRNADGFVFQTPDAEKYFDKIISKNQLSTIIANPLPANLPVRKYNEENKRLIAACRLSHQKNLFMMIDSISDVINKGTECTLDIFGAGPLHDNLLQYIKGKHLETYVFLKGFSQNIHVEMANSCAFLISSNYEGISNSMIEAMAIGVPVVATDCPIGGARMFVKDNENGYLVPLGDQKRFSFAVQRLLNYSQENKKMGENAKIIRDELTAEKISEAWLIFLEKVIRKNIMEKFKG